MRKRRTKAEIERDNINYVLSKNRKAIETALNRYDELTKAREEWNLPPSFAILKGLAALNINRLNPSDIENFENKNYYEVLAELTRVNEFNSDPGSRVKGAKEEARRYMNLFGKGMWARTNLYDMTTESTESTDLLNEEAAKRAFRAYRNIERMRAAEIVNVGGFGSDNFVAYLYSMELQGKDSQVYGEEILDLFEDQKYGITRDLSDLTYMPSSYKAVTRLSNKKRGDIYDNEW